MSQEEIIDTNKGIIPWFARNSVAANLLMVVILFVGIGSALAIQRTLQPEFEINIITITVPYPGATPENLYESVTKLIEQEMNGATGMLYFDSVSDAQGSVTINITFEAGTDPQVATVDVQNRISRV